MSRDEEVSPVDYLLLDGKMHKLDDIRALLAQRHASPPAAVAVTDATTALFVAAQDYLQHWALDEATDPEVCNMLDQHYSARNLKQAIEAYAALTTSSAQSAGGLDG